MCRGNYYGYMDNTKKSILGFITVVVLFFIWRYISNPLVVTVTGSGKVTVPATLAKISATIVETGDTVDKTELALRAKIATVRLGMVTNGVTEKSLAQSQVQITPLAAVVSGAKGYSATVAISGETSEVANLNSLIVKVYSAGASIVSQPVVEVSNQQELENSALLKALEEADVNAKFMAKLKNKMFKKVASVQQASSGNSSTTTKVAEKDGVVGSSFEVAKAVSVVYYLW